MLDLSRFDTLTFDCYGTLVDWETGILSALRPILAAHGTSLEDATLLKLYGDFEQLSEEGEYQSYREVLQSVVRSFGTQLGFTPSLEEVQSLPDSISRWVPWPDTVAALRTLQPKHRLAIISNIDDDLFAATRIKLQVQFDDVITAQQAQAYKPSLKIFQLALSRLGTPVERILHVGQSVFHDVVPAQKLGLASVRVNRPSARAGVGAVKSAEAKADWEVPDLASLAGAISLH